MNDSLVFHNVLVDQSFFCWHVQYSIEMGFKDKNDLCSCYVSKANMMQCKHDICVNQNVDISKIEKC